MVAIYEEIFLEGHKPSLGLRYPLTAAQDGFSRRRGRGINYPRHAHSRTVWFCCSFLVFSQLPSFRAYSRDLLNTRHSSRNNSASPSVPSFPAAPFADPYAAPQPVPVIKAKCKLEVRPQSGPGNRGLLPRRLRANARGILLRQGSKARETQEDVCFCLQPRSQALPFPLPSA